MLRLLVWLTLLVGSSCAMAQPGQSRILTLTQKDRSELQGRLDWARSLIQKRYGIKTSLRETGDLAVLQRIVDERVVPQRDTFNQQSLGLAFGSIVVQSLGYHWVKIDDELGKDLAIQFKDTSVVAFPLTSISKRVEQERRIDLKALYRFLAQSRSIQSPSQYRTR